MAIEIVGFPIQNGDFPVRYVNIYQRVTDESMGNLWVIHGQVWVISSGAVMADI